MDIIKSIKTISTRPVSVKTCVTLTL